MRTCLEVGVLVAATVLAATPAAAQSALLTLPDVSQHARVEQRVGITDIAIDYHRPLVHGRKIFGGMLPYGAVWRAGADYNTTISFSDAVTVDGQPLPKGTYGLHMIPGQTSWVVIFSRNSTSWGSFSYDEAEDALRVTVQPRVSDGQEALSYDFDELTNRAAVITMRWERVAVPFEVEVDTPNIVARSLRDQLRGRVQTEWQAWEEAANYLLENGLDPRDALKYADTSIGIEDRFENEITRARALDALGRSAEADSTRRKAFAVGTQLQVYTFGRNLQRLGQQQAALRVFRDDLRRDPESWIGHAEASRVAVGAGDFPSAIREMQLAVAVAPNALKPTLQDLERQLNDRVDVNR